MDQSDDTSVNESQANISLVELDRSQSQDPKVTSQPVNPKVTPQPVSNSEPSQPARHQVTSQPHDRQGTSKSAYQQVVSTPLIPRLNAQGGFFSKYHILINPSKLKNICT